MRNSTRRKQKIYFLSRTRDDSDIDISYTYEIFMKRMSVSTTSGSPFESDFGMLPTYDRYLISFVAHNPLLHEGMYVYIDKTPEFDENGNLVLDTDGEPTVKPDYLLNRIFQTKRGVIKRYGVKKISSLDEE